MPVSPPSEFLQAWALCRSQRWRLPVWAQGDDAFLQGCWQWLQSQLQSTDRIFWLGDPWPAQHGQLQIRQITGQARQQLLGQECDVLIVQASKGMDWDLVAASMGCLTAGGIWLLLSAEAEIFSQQPNPAARRLLSYPTDATQHIGRFQQWLATQWQQQPLVHWSRSGLDNGLLPSSAVSTTGAYEPPYASHCQQLAVAAIHRVASGHRHRPLVLSAHRGRGKSAALGLAAAQLQQAGKTRLIITAPQPAAAQVALETCQRQLGEQTPSQLQFWPLDRLLAELPAADLLLIDEAAAIPAPQLQALTENYSRVVFATTEHGYEGTGRGFQLRFQQYLQQHRPGWRKLVLQQPIRYSEADPLEQLIFQSFLLADQAELPSPASAEFRQFHHYTATHLAGQPALLQQIFGLACLAHYQTSVRDLWALLDDPALQVITLQQSDRVLAVAIVCKEGQLPADLVPEIYQGNRRVQGHLAAQSLVYHCLTPEAGILPIWRIQRLMVLPEAQRRGLGQALLTHISELASTQQTALLATSFGATPALVSFWQHAGYHAVKLSAQPEQSSNEYSVLMLKVLQPDLPWDISSLRVWFGQSLYIQARTVWRALDPLLLREWARPPQSTWSSRHQQELLLFLHGQRDWQQAVVTLRLWLDLHVHRLTPTEAQLWLPLCWQGKDSQLNTTELKTLSLQLRQTFALSDLYQTPLE